MGRTMTYEQCRKGRILKDGPNKGQRAGHRIRFPEPDGPASRGYCTRCGNIFWRLNGWPHKGPIQLSRERRESVKTGSPLPIEPHAREK